MAKVPVVVAPVKDAADDSEDGAKNTGYYAEDGSEQTHDDPKKTTQDAKSNGDHQNAEEHGA